MLWRRIFPFLCTMPLFLASINSGSNGNCYYIGNETEAILIDAGISNREIIRRMNGLGLPIEKVKAIFISHEHTDHTRGVAVLSRRHCIPVYITEKTRWYSGIGFDKDLVRPFSGGEPVPVGGLSVEPFLKSHDAADPHSFTVHGDGLTVGVFTDLGLACDRVIHQMGRCHAAFLESNYDEGMLERGPYPRYLKRRIRGEQGHLSNLQALELFLNHRSPELKLLILSHLSAQNNHPKLVGDLFSFHSNGVRIEVASRSEACGVFRVE
ncbi:MAG: MBL fold metallo-hydrolase [Bacteroidales bacterium]|nr:MBL fold metallo-hydrolase [Bacteroidales bacterium]